MMLDKIIAEKWLTATGVMGIFPANTVNRDDIELYDPNDPARCIHVQRSLRQQTKKTEGQPNLALADFVAPKESGLRDYVGGFVVTTGLGIETHLQRFEADHDDYSSI